MRLMFPVNQTVADYYVKEYGFQDVTDDGSKDILYRSVTDLIDEFKT
ncbi:hypothetical protein PT300_13535 [Enterobacteriaceae bacterium ESL0689]|nr:hypothetical protein [Enterobacteriaceae bacterium ESL0689]